MNRRAIVAGQFYPSDVREMEQMIVACATGAGEARMAPTLLAMLPHAGWIYSGPVCAHTLAQANLPDTLVILGPNHTGRGDQLAVWPEGLWELPGGGLPVDAFLAAKLIADVPGFTADVEAHVQEHSIEVTLPFLRHFNNNVRIVPVSVSARDPKALTAAGEALAGVLGEWKEPVALVVSSDMSHYLPENQTKERDSLALQRILEMDAAGLYDTVARHGISMCGVLPMTLGLTAARAMGATETSLAAYATSGDASGDYSSVVGYAGVLVQ